ncbi:MULTISPECIES: alpha/beta hydrolase [Chryseobacterium]|uniref:alpha/beta hydrolase n=1 Tax=Chryseobacterium TaxID=59732 RepID=UPI00068F153C|nr:MULTISPECIES: alpha/beta hydrolase [Chryseobacterium]MBF6643397.1 alpha/beta hydrolase [Chryseobacterium indologenes]MBU3047096.1 alpha/beta hydrolase [Chryseobacterium indologenes]MEB4762518.1 alpha/beta hydrolase [Chryseobacterium indologenes]QQQ72721.1 alpha/beta hydrolase [Chryseobacterium indologenes]
MIAFIKKNSALAVLTSLIMLLSCTDGRAIDEPGNLVPKTVDQDTSLPFISINGAKLHSEAFGPEDGTIVIPLHGGPGGDYRYLFNCKNLINNGYRVVFYDQRGSGLSQRFSRQSYLSLGAEVMELMYDELHAVIAYYRKKPEQKVVLLGHSWGAMLASGYAGKYPNDIQGLILCEPGGLVWNDVTHYVKESRSFKIWNEILNDATYLDQFISGKEDQHEILDYKMLMLASKNSITGEGDFDPSISWRSGAVIMDALFESGDKYNIDFSKGLQNYNGPVLFFYSEKNKAYPDSWAQKITSSYKNVTKVKIPGVGHDGIISNLNAWDNYTKPQIITLIGSL